MPPGYVPIVDLATRLGETWTYATWKLVYPTQVSRYASGYGGYAELSNNVLDFRLASRWASCGGVGRARSATAATFRSPGAVTRVAAAGSSALLRVLVERRSIPNTLNATVVPVLGSPRAGLDYPQWPEI